MSSRSRASCGVRGASDGATCHEALADARDLLRELIAVTMREGGALPEPSPAGR